MVTRKRSPGGPDEIAKLLEQYGCGPVRFTGAEHALYERHLVFDNVLDPSAVGPRGRFEAVARSVRDVLSQRWVRTDQTYDRENPKRVYYLSLEFLIGRSLANNVTNLLLDPLVSEAVRQKGVDLPGFAGGGAGRGLGQRRFGALGGLFSRFPGYFAIPGHGLWVAL